MNIVAIIPALANKGLLEIEMENARREIKNIMDKQEKNKLVDAIITRFS